MPEFTTPQEEASAVRALASGVNCPYDHDDDDQALASRDWADYAARGVMADLTGRRGFDLDIDQETRREIIESIAAIIRIAPQQYLTAQTPEE